MKMKLDKGAIFASMAIIMVASVFAGAGTTALFSTEKKTAGIFTMDAATMTMTVTAGPYTFDNLVPGQEFGPITITIVNTGSMDITYLGGDLVITYAGGSPVSSDSGLANVIEITSWREKCLPGYDWIQNVYEAIQHYETLVENGASPLTLMELAKSYSTGTEPTGAGADPLDQFGHHVRHITDWVTGDGYDQVPAGTPAIAKGQTYYMQFWFKLSADAGNEYQGATCYFKISFTGVQETSQLP